MNHHRLKNHWISAKNNLKNDKGERDRQWEMDGIKKANIQY